MNKHKFIIKNREKIVGVIETNDDYCIGAKILTQYGINMKVIKKYMPNTYYYCPDNNYTKVSVNNSDIVLCSWNLYKKI